MRNDVPRISGQPKCTLQSKEKEIVRIRIMHISSANEIDAPNQTEMEKYFIEKEQGES